MAKYKSHLLVCGGTGCIASASDSIAANLKDELAKKRSRKRGAGDYDWLLWILRKGANC